MLLRCEKWHWLTLKLQAKTDKLDLSVSNWHRNRHFEFNLQTLKCPNPLKFKGKEI